MKLIADESIDRQIVDHLRRDGHSVTYVAEMAPGVSDEAVLDMANREEALLVTSDKDFGELVFRQGRLTRGIILVRLAGLAPGEKAQVVASVVSRYTSELAHAFAVVTRSAIRIRRRPG